MEKIFKSIPPLGNASVGSYERIHEKLALNGLGRFHPCRLIRLHLFEDHPFDRASRWLAIVVSNFRRRSSLRLP